MSDQAATQEQEQQSQPQVPQVIQIGEKGYAVESITEQGRNILSDIERVNARLEQLQEKLGVAQLDVSIANLGKSKLVDILSQEAAKFKEVPLPEVQQAV